MRTGLRSLISILFVLLFLWVGLRWLLPLLFPFLLGLGLALAAEPLVSPLCRHLKFPRSLGALLGVSAAFGGISLLGLLAGAFLLRELRALAGVLPDLADTAGSSIALLRDWLLGLSARAPESVRPLLEQNVTGLFSGGTALLEGALGYVLNLAGNLLKYLPDSALGLGTAIISGYMLSVRLPRIKNWLLTRLSRRKLAPILEAGRRIRRALGGWLTAQCKLAGVTFALLLPGLMLLRISHAPLWAAGITVLDALPVLGTGTALLPWALVCQLQGQSARALGLLGLYGLICLVRSVLEPKLVGKELGLDPLVTLMVLYAGFRLWGLAGMLLAPALTVTALQLLPIREEPG